MPKRAKEYMDSVRDRLADAAYECFLENGLANTTMRDICVRADASMGALYTHFADKIALLEEALPRIAKEDVFAPMAEDWRTFERIYIVGLRDAGERHVRRNIALSLEISALVVRGTEPHNVLSRIPRQTEDRIAVMLGTYASNGEITLPLGERATASALFAWLAGCTLELATSRSCDDIADYVHKAIRFGRFLVGAKDYHLADDVLT